MARRRRSFFRRMTRRASRRIRRSRRGVGRAGGFLKTITQRPLKVISGALGLASVGILATDTDADGQSVVTDLLNAQSSNGQSLQNIPFHLVNAVTKGNWIGPTVGAAVTGYLSRRFKL